MKVLFNKEGFTKDVQQPFGFPQFDKLREGNLGEWLVALLFIPTLGLLVYPITFLGNINVKFS